MLSKLAPYYTLTLKVISRVLAPYSHGKLSHSLPPLTSLGSHWTSVPSVSPAHLICSLKSFWPPCSMPVLQVIFCSRITAYQLHTSQTSKLLCPPVSRSIPSPTSSEYLPRIHFLIPKILYWVFLSLKVTFTMLK